jgi:hypothetical protein
MVAACNTIMPGGAVASADRQGLDRGLDGAPPDMRP